MRLTVDDDRETIKRYAHIRRPRGLGVRRCSARCAGTKYACTMALDHRGPHVAHTPFGRVVAVWDTMAVAKRSSEAAERARSAGADAVRAGKAREVRSAQSKELRGLLGRRVGSLAFYLEEIALGIMFLAFIWFAIDWLMLIFGG